MNRRNFIKNATGWALGAGGILVPKLIHASGFTLEDQAFMGTVGTPAASGFYTANLLAWWQLNGNGNDSSGNGNNLTLVGSPTFGTGKNFAQAMVLNGTSQYATGPNIGDFPTNQTMMCWCKTTAPTNFNCLMSKLSAGGSASGQGMCLNIESPLFNNAFITFIQNNSGGTWTGTSTNGSVTCNDGQWHHTAMVISSTYTVTSYHNGSTTNVVSYDDSTVNSTYTNTNGWMVGNSTASEFWNGTIADCRIYSAALSPTIIAAIAAGKA